MKILILTAVTLVFCLGQLSIAQETPDSLTQGELMAKYMELAQPGEEHKMLEKLTGDWDFEAKMWATPGAEMAVYPGKAEGKMVLGGRFLYGEFTTEAGEMSGEGIFIIGFDRRYEVFTYVGFDTWGTYWASASGTYDSTTNSITLDGEDDDPVMGITQEYDFVITFISDDSWKFEIIYYDEAHTQGAEEFKMGEVVYTRAEVFSPSIDSLAPLLHSDSGPMIGPELVFRHPPEYPRITDSASVSSAVWVRALVDLEGNVREAIVHKSSGAMGFDEAAITAAYKNKFKPAMQNGRPVECWVTYKIVFGSK
ncbi:MAG: TonB family protein [Candidatus Zixiibacteriota bacterium]|nr:MAG: TonB family protein [candidate division Zixibacteria bacterium]